MRILKRVLAVLVIIFAVFGMVVCLAGIWFSWSLNTPVTETLTGVVMGAERVLTAADNGLTRVNEGLGNAVEAVGTIEDAVQSAGETIVDTSLAFVVLERTVGDTLFPRVISAQEKIQVIAETVIAFNETLEAANRMPFFDVPTLTDELSAAADRLTAARQRVEELQAEIRAAKEDKVSRPVTFITDRTGVLIENLDVALQAVDGAQARIADRLERLATTRARLPRIVDLVSLFITLVMLWFFAAQGSLLLRAYEYLSGKRIDWGRRLRRGDKTVDEAV